MRSFFWLLRLLVSLIYYLLLSVMSVVFHFVLLPLLIAVVRLLGGLIFLSIRAIVVGPRQYINRLAGEWTERIHQGTDNREHIYEVYQLCRVLVGTIIVLGLSVQVIFTVAVLRVVFG